MPLTDLIIEFVDCVNQSEIGLDYRVLLHGRVIWRLVLPLVVTVHG